MKGAPALSIRHLAGHEDLQTTLGYMHLAKGETERAIGLLENADRWFECARQRQPDGNGTLGGSEHRELIQETGWRRLQPIRTISRLDLDFAVFTQDAFRFQAIQAEASTMRRLGMSLRAIGVALGVDEKTVRKALAGLAS